MARKEKLVTITREGRDKGRVYHIQEMAATQGELFAARAFLGIAQGGLDVPEDLRQSGMAGLSKFGLELIAKLKFNDAKELMTEMMDCVSFVPDPRNPSFHRALIDDDIDEVMTRLELRKEWFALHFDFFASAAPSTPEGSAAEGLS